MIRLDGIAIAEALLDDPPALAHFLRGAIERRGAQPRTGKESPMSYARTRTLRKLEGVASRVFHDGHERRSADWLVSQGLAERRLGLLYVGPERYSITAAGVAKLKEITRR